MFLFGGILSCLNVLTFTDIVTVITVYLDR
jgi:hypothetical protein